MGEASDWHEQVEFSEMYFAEHKKCREAQRASDVFTWCSAVKSKMIMAGGILKPDEKTRCDVLRKTINFHLRNYQNSLDFNEMSGRIPMDSLSSKLHGDVEDCLCDVETEVDTMVNGHMSFLNIRKQVDISGL